MGDQNFGGTAGGTATQVDVKSMTGPELADYATTIERRVFTLLPEDQLDQIQPIWNELVTRVKTTDTAGKSGQG